MLPPSFPIPQPIYSPWSTPPPTDQQPHQPSNPPLPIHRIPPLLLPPKIRRSNNLHTKQNPRPIALELITAARDKGVKVLAGHHRRFNPYLVAAKKALDEKILGQVIAVQGTWCLRKPAAYYDGIGEWRRSGESGGVVLINLVHEVDLLQYLLGPITIISAVETAKTRGFDAEEGAAIILRFESGVVGTFLLSDSTPSPWNFEGGTAENPMIPQVGGDDSAAGFYRILGTKGSLRVLDLTKWTGEWNEKLGRELLDVQKENVPFIEQIEHFAKVVRCSERPRCTAEEALSAMVICEAVKEAMRSGKWIDIDGFEVKVRRNDIYP
ncbi:hypothetical protein IFR05_009129 [Cadophora sp. M221]|nr:hypothetical protein IFR05_009129 [Cadophora sp. M221]